jgi:DNA-binding transcriptional ArsR family regulator
MNDEAMIDYAKYARIFKVMSDPKRLKIIDMLSEGELCACKILEEFHITQPTLSHDMKCSIQIKTNHPDVHFLISPFKHIHINSNKQLNSSF